MKSSYDVIVVGGGTAGVVAGIQAARAGASTLVIEKCGMLGGTVTLGGVSAPASFHAYGEQIISGIGWELCCRARAEVGQSEPDPHKEDWRRVGRLHVSVNVPNFAAVADEMLIESGADILLHAMPAAARLSGEEWTLTVCTKTGLRDLCADVLIDCTGDANVVQLAGLALDSGPEHQPATLVAHCAGYDYDTLDIDAIQTAFEAEVEAGRMKRSDPGWGEGKIEFLLRNYGGNKIQVTDIDATTSEGKTEAEIAARRAMLRIQRFCRKQPGLENFHFTSCAAETGIRETSKIRGRKTISVEDYESGRVWDDSVCYSFYPIDLHRPDCLTFRAIAKGVKPTIPLGAMLPEDGRRIIVAGRCAAGDRLAHSAYRVEASCMAMGQAAGAAAALAARHGIDCHEVDMQALRALLAEHKAIVPPA